MNTDVAGGGHSACAIRVSSVFICVHPWLQYSVFDYLIRRLISTVPVLLAVSAFVFLFVHLLPGDPARLVAGPDATQQDIAAVRADMGLDRPLLVQFLRYLGETAQLILAARSKPTSRSRS